MPRRLSLCREHLAELTPDELPRVAGGVGNDTIVCPSERLRCNELLAVIRTTVQTITCWC